MTVTLTSEQSRQLSEMTQTYSFAVDPASRRRYVLLGSDVFERLRMLIGEASLQDALSPAWGDTADAFD